MTSLPPRPASGSVFSLQLNTPQIAVALLGDRTKLLFPRLIVCPVMRVRAQNLVGLGRLAIPKHKRVPCRTEACYPIIENATKGVLG